MDMVKFYKKRGKTIWKRKFILRRKTGKCQKVADAFTELYEMADIIVLDVGRYGFVMRQYYMPLHGLARMAEIILWNYFVKKLSVISGSTKQGKALSMTGFFF